MARPITQTMAELIIAAVETGKDATFTVNGITYDFDPEGILAYIQAEGGFTSGEAAAEFTDLTATGNVIFSGLPTADPEIAGALWLDTGVLTVSAGA